MRHSGSRMGCSGWATRCRRRGRLTWTQRLPILLLAGARAREALAISSGEARGWLALGSALWSLSEDLTSHPAGPAEAWDPARGLAGVQAIYAFRRTIALEPVAGEVLAALLTMKSDYHSRGMIDARDWADELSKQFTPRAAPPEAQPLRPSAVEAVSLPPGAGTSELSELFEDRLRHGRTLAAVELARQAEARGIALPWELADRVAITHLHLGEPAEARRYWERAQAPPSPALRLARIAQAELALTDIEAAEKTFRAALDSTIGSARPGSGSPCSSCSWATPTRPWPPATKGCRARSPSRNAWSSTSSRPWSTGSPRPARGKGNASP